MFRLFTALFVLLLIVGFQNCSGKLSTPDESTQGTSPNGYKIISTTLITADSAIVGEGYLQSATMSSTEAPSIMPAPADVRVELRMSKDEIVGYSLSGSRQPRVCDLTSNPDYVELKLLLLAQKVCHFKSNVPPEEWLAQQRICPVYAASQGPVAFHFSVYTYKPGVASAFLTHVLSRSSWADDMNLCDREFFAFCSDSDNDRIAELAQRLADGISTFDNCHDDTPVDIDPILTPIPMPKPLPEPEPIPMPKLPGI